MNERDDTLHPDTVPVPPYALIPQSFGDFERLDFGHPGGMGVVYKVLNRKLNVERALKVLKPDVAHRISVRDAFIREANFGAQLAAGPYILPVHAVGSLQGWDFIEMDWVEGPNLAEFLRERGKLDPWAALTLCSMVLDALNYAHRHPIRYQDGTTKDGIIHRDIKPANILIDRRTARPLLTDFGIALAREAARDRKGGYTAGTINYLPPELIQDRPVDERSDIYQVGLVLYELLAGQKAFPGGDEEGVPGNIMNGYKKRAVRLERHVKKLDGPVIGIVERALELDPADRVQSAGTMRDEIRTYLRRKYVAHDPQQALSKYLEDGSVPGRRFSENETLKRAKKQVPRVLWTLLVLAIFAAGVWGGRHIYVRHVKAEFERERDTCAAQKAAWDKQEWSATEIDAMNRELQEILRLGEAREYRVARDRAIAMTDQMRQEIAPLERDAGEARARYEEELRVFMLQKWPRELVARINTSDTSVRNVISSEIYSKTRDVCRGQYQVLFHYDSTKAEEFGKSADQKETKRSFYATGYAGTPCGDSAAALAVTLARIREDYGGQRRYQEGIDALNGIQIPGSGWNCGLVPHPPQDRCAQAQADLQVAQEKLSEFKSRPDWQARAQSKQFPQCNVPAVEGYLGEAVTLLKARDCDGTVTRTSSATQCLEQLTREYPVSDTAVHLPPPLPPSALTPDSAYRLGEAAYRARHWLDACELLKLVPDNHGMYREARLMMAESQCALRGFNEVTLEFYRMAGPLVFRDKALSFTNMLQCFYKLGMCDSVDLYFDKAIGTGELKCDGQDGRYANALYCKVSCDYRRYDSARARNDDDQKVLWGSSVLQNCRKYFECFPGARWKVQGDQVHTFCNGVHE